MLPFESKGVHFDDEHVICFTGHDGRSTRATLRVVDIDLNKNYKESMLHKVGISNPNLATRPALHRSCDYITKDNVIFGGTLNTSNNGVDGYTPYCAHPSNLAIASYNRASNSVNDGMFYEDGVNHYWMTSLSATKDGGGIAIATRANPEQAELGINAIVLLKYKRREISVNDAESNAKFAIYPNPAINEVTLNSDGVGEELATFYDATGRIAKQIIITAAEITVDISDLNRGIYLIKLSNNNNTQKLIVK